ncbi:hypothetical protein C0Q70_01253 [Pomacea canaliculata]|uniref:Uncharacterized protein n=1 Tax=Pomacea canaliculata TaxID=400727 RepID=A0A2T7PZ15_POMCA|nr:hypothetical protein C0Q70_01253 [Pomacea canaliculata]
MQALLSKARQQDVLALLSPCLLVFAVPLLLPGVTITTVGLLDNPGFPKYGALHVVGMILLAFSIVLIGQASPWVAPWARYRPTPRSILEVGDRCNQSGLLDHHDVDRVNPLFTDRNK